MENVCRKREEINPLHERITAINVLCRLDVIFPRSFLLFSLGNIEIETRSAFCLM